MFNKIKEIGVNVSTIASSAVDGVSNTMKTSVDSISNAAADLSDAINEKAVRASTAQMCKILEIAIEELKLRPLSERPISLTSVVNFGVASLEMQIQLLPYENEEQK
jgi:hypothetical protein